jgi:hypothetical protein
VSLKQVPVIVSRRSRTLHSRGTQVATCRFSNVKAQMKNRKCLTITETRDCRKGPRSAERVVAGPAKLDGGVSRVVEPTNGSTSTSTPTSPISAVAAPSSRCARRSTPPRAREGGRHELHPENESPHLRRERSRHGRRVALGLEALAGSATGTPFDVGCISLLRSCIRPPCPCCQPCATAACLSPTIPGNSAM